MDRRRPEAIAGFKAAVAKHLAPLASGFLLDDGYDVPVGSGLILAADRDRRDRPPDWTPVDRGYPLVVRLAHH